jgi:hypothetical protein
LWPGSLQYPVLKMSNPNLRVPDYSPLAGFLSFLVPGLGQIQQGRTGKGILFLVCLYGLFFYGMHLGHWKNVYLPDTARDNSPATNPWGLWRPAANLYNRLQYAGQFWIGVVAWPALWQYVNYDESRERTTIFGDFQRTPASEDDLNKLQRESDKTWDLGWVYTVIAGVLNILVIYDAFAGPAFAEGERAQRAAQEAAPA